MPFTNRKFGVEIEYTGINRSELRNLLSQNGYNVYPNGRGSVRQWSVVNDSSVTGSCETSNRGGELISPILSGQSGLEAIGDVAKLMSRNGARVDQTCGLHVHVDVSDLSIDEIKMIAHRYTRFESEIDRFMPQSRRSNNNNYCLSMNYYLIQDINRCNSRDNFYFVQRYHKVNLHAYYKYKTVEFRQHSGSVNSEKIKNWVKFCVSFVEETRNVYSKLVQIQQGNTQNNLQNINNNVINSNIPTNYPFAPADDSGNVRIVNRDLLEEDDFRYLGYYECNGLSIYTIFMVLKKLIIGFDINTQRVHTYSPSTVRRVMSVLRNVGFNIDHRRGTGYYILSEIQPRRIFTDTVQRTLFNLNNLNDNTFISNLYDSSFNDTLFSGIDNDVASFYRKRAEEFARNP